MPFTVCYVVLDSAGAAHLLDSGTDSPENRDHLSTQLLRIGVTLESVASLTCTHVHYDHIGLATWISEQNGVPIALHRFDRFDLESGAIEARFSDDADVLGERYGVPQAQRYRLSRAGAMAPPAPALDVRFIDDGEMLPIPGRSLYAVHTPGHTRGHLCFVMPEEKILLSGDHVLPDMYPGIGRGGTPPDADPVSDYLASLQRVAEYDDYLVAPGHGLPFVGLKERRTRTASHVLRRADEIRAAVTSHPQASTWEIASMIAWGGGWEALEGTRLQSALAQTRMYSVFVGGARGALEHG
jgi:glyoxylase-like metal-dependent hydrolase (beta-lactamase superfamily II)